MTAERFAQIVARYPQLRVAMVGDFCLDRYLEIDPALAETSIETGLTVHNVTRVRSQPGAAGTILNNLVALGLKEIYPIGFCGEDGEGYELQRALRERGTAVRLDHFLVTPERRTFTYAKPLVLTPGKPPQELNRLDSKNWSPTSRNVEDAIIRSVRRLAEEVDALILMDQVDVPETGVVTRRVLAAVHEVTLARPQLTIVADSRRGLGEFPPVIFKMNAAELAAITKVPGRLDRAATERAAVGLAQANQRVVIVTLAEQGILGAAPNGTVEHRPALPIRGPIDIVGAGDSVTANVTAALTAGASVGEAIDLANAAASTVIHQLGTTGTASVEQIGACLGFR